MLGPRNNPSIKVQLELRVTTATRDAELEALETFMNTMKSPAVERATSKSIAFRYYVLLHEPTIWTNLEELFPHMFNFDLIEDEFRREFAKRIVSNFDQHQVDAYNSLRKIPHGLRFLPGGPGAGKTRWALNVVTLAQMSKKKVRVLYLMDINKPVDDLATRLAGVYEQIPGKKGKVIRMYGYAKEEGRGRNPGAPDFSPAFIRQVKRMSPGATVPCGGEDFFTLDAAAWDFLHQHQDEFVGVMKLIDTLRHAWQNNELDEIPGRQTMAALVRPLYQKTLQDAEFIVTTPVAAAHHSFAAMFKPDLIFFDEAAHARDLSTLIPLAFFNAKAHFFLGDHRQVTPYVAFNHRYCRQLAIPSIRRAMEVDHGQSQLLINHRAYGQLHELSSSIWYGNAMISAYDEGQLLPDPVRQVRKYLDDIRGHQAAIPRLIVTLRDSKKWVHADVGTSSWNPAHHAWVVSHVEELLEKPWFTKLDGETPGSVLIITALKESFSKYQKQFSRWHLDKRRRVNVRTIDTAQGHEADIVVVDIAKLSKFTNDPCRLCVATTRAILGEIILMPRPSHPDDTLYKIFYKCYSQSQIYDQIAVEHAARRAAKIEAMKLLEALSLKEKAESLESSTAEEGLDNTAVDE